MADTPADFRSDTVTRPTPAMLQAMMSAPVGDDVWGDDPTVNQLQLLAAEMFGMEAALFCPSGTMTNQIAIKVHTQPGDELICSNTAHILLYEGGGIAFNSGVQAKPLQGDGGSRLTAPQIQASISSSDDPHYPRTTLVCLENSTNKGGGACYSLAAMQEISQVCRAAGIGLHLDGARLFNAIVASKAGGPGVEGQPYGPREVGSLFDSISICLSKGLGCPVGSLLLGTQAFITRARRVRKVFGGGMRQAGFLAAAGVYALQNNVTRLDVDHARAHALGAALQALPSSCVESVGVVSTNIVVWLVPLPHDPQVVVEHMKRQGVLISSMGGRMLRMVTHLDVTDEHLQRAREAIKRLPELMAT